MKCTERSRQEVRGVQAWGVAKGEGPGENTWGTEGELVLGPLTGSRAGEHGQSKEGLPLYR